MQKITPFLWFENQAEEAMNFYVSLFPNSRIVQIERYAGGQGIPGEDQLKGRVLTGVFELNGQTFMCLDGGKQPGFGPSGIISFLVEFDTQTELDKVWDELAQDGHPQQCGWISDKYGITWQIVPRSLGQMMSDPAATPEQKQNLTQAMLKMVKLDQAELEKAFRG